MKHGFVRVAASIPELQVADCAYNVSKIIELSQKADIEHVEVICFPELCITAYTCADLFSQAHLYQAAHKAMHELAEASKQLSTVIIVGVPLAVRNQLYNCAVVLFQGKILGAVPKINLPNHNEFYEKRWFAPGSSAKSSTVTFCNQDVAFGTDLLFSNGEFTFGIEICEDVWVPIPPSSQLALHGADILFNLSASNELIGKHQYLRKMVEQQSARCSASYVYCSSGAGESTSDLVFAGNGLIYENGVLLAASKRFSFEPQLIISDVDVERLRGDRMCNTNYANERSDRVYRTIQFDAVQRESTILKRSFDKFPFVPPLSTRQESCEEIFSIQVGGLAKRWQHTNAETLVLGISGGLDSTLALLVCVKTADKLGYDRKRVVGITMPGYGTSDRTYSNAVNLMKVLGVEMMEISIVDACNQHFIDIEHDAEVHDVTYENTQARERTKILMNIANKRNGLVIGTGDLSELALGWATYNGDHMSMYGVNSGVPKTLVRYLVGWAAQTLDASSEKILLDVLDTPVSPELLPADAQGKIAQKTEDIVGPYELHDFFLYYFVRYGYTPQKILFLANLTFNDTYDQDTIEKWFRVFIRRFFSQQFKRSCMPDGPKVGSINLSPRGDWRMPSDAVGFEF
jgi:NAD+ synthase (glutamine-hydrolysing)